MSLKIGATFPPPESTKELIYYSLCNNGVINNSETWSGNLHALYGYISVIIK